jgi:hypothetical protein
MSLVTRLRQRSTLTALANVLFAGGILLLFVTLYKDASVSGSGPLWVIALGVLVAAGVCWILAARLGETSPE